MNIDLNAYPVTQNEIQVTMNVEQSTNDSEPKEFNDEEAEKQIEGILLIRYIENNGDHLVYRLHPKRKETYIIVHKNIHDSLKRIDPFYTEDYTCFIS